MRALYAPTAEVPYKLILVPCGIFAVSFMLSIPPSLLFLVLTQATCSVFMHRRLLDSVEIVIHNVARVEMR